MATSYVDEIFRERLVVIEIAKMIGHDYFWQLPANEKPISILS
jgi:hypothetical protein